MSIPKNHHYVPQCLIKNFVNSERKFSCYDKVKKNHYRIGSSKRIFSENELNTILDEEGNPNHSEIENQLNNEFESEFPKHYNIVKGLINDKDDEYLNTISRSGELKSALYYLIRLGLIGVFRNPNFLKNTDEEIQNAFREIQLNADVKLSLEIEELFNRQKKTKYNSHTDFKELADGLIKHMGEHIFTIYIAPSNEYFIMPDCQSTYRRDILDEDVIVDGVAYKSMCNVVSMLGYPIDSRFFLSIESKKISAEKFDRIKRIDKSTLLYINYCLYNSAYKNVLCENENYLKTLVAKFDEIVSKP